MNWVNEISFNISVPREMRAISFVTRLIEQSKINSDGQRQTLIHGIHADEEMGSSASRTCLSPVGIS